MSSLDHRTVLEVAAGVGSRINYFSDNVLIRDSLQKLRMPAAPSS